MRSNSREVNLTIDSRIISHLGEALIDNEKIALLELIKNASDADANNCNIEIDTFYQSKYGKGRIIIEDDGNGMTPFILEKAFLKIASSYKLNHQKISPKFKRQAQGNKGIGRLSLNQLGRFVSVDTKFDTSLADLFSNEEIQESFGYSTKELLVGSNDVYYYNINIDWEKYNNSEGAVENVKLDLHTKPFNENIFNHDKPHGTRIEILGLKGIDFWRSSQTQKEIEQDVLEFLNPYLDEKFNFYVRINLDNFKFTSDNYDITDIENNFFSKVNFSFNLKNSEVILEITRSKKYIDYKVDSLIKELQAWDMDLVSKKPVSEYYNKWTNEQLKFNLSNLETANSTASNVKFDKFIKYFKDVMDDKLQVVTKEIKFFLPGDFRGVIYGFDLSTDSPISKKFKKVLSEIKGVKLYRNNFRIFPYGGKNNDWLEMSDYNQRDKGVVYKQHSSTGFVNIDGEDNLERLKELTNRQGLVLDNYGTNFILILQDLIYRSAARRDKTFREFFNFSRKEIDLLNGNETITIAGMIFKKRVDELDKAEFHTDTFISSFGKLSEEEKKDKAISIQKSIKNIRNELSLKNNQYLERERHLDEFVPIMGATIIAETLSHEIIRLSNNIKIYSLKARSAVKNNEKEEALDNILRIDSSNKFLVRYASLLDVNSYSRRRKYSIVSIKDNLENILKDSPLLTYGDQTIEYSIKGNDFKAKLVGESFKIIIENMLINSTYWLNKVKVDMPNIIFELDDKLEKLTIFDNGIGIDKTVEEHVFEEFVTNKPDGDGRGMGLYIVSSLLNEIGATINLDQERNKYGNLYKFIITFPSVEV